MAGNTNFANIGDLEKDGGNNFTFSEANMKYSTTTNNRGFILPFGFPSTGKYYYEMYILGVGGTQDHVFPGVCTPETMRGQLTSTRGGATGTYGGYVYDNYFGYAKLNGTNQTADSIGHFRSFPQKVGILVNRDDNEIKWTLNGTDFSSAYTIPSGELRPYLGSGGGSNTASGYFNFGQDSTFGGAVSAGGNADSSGYGDFTFSVPSNYVSLSSANLPTSTDIDPAETDDDIPTKQFNTVIYTGTGSTQTISTVDFQPDLVWIKQRNGTNVHELYDSSRGATKRLQSNATNTEDTRSTELTAFATNGFTVGTSTFGGVNGSTNTYVAWNWRANGGTTATNTSGTSNSTVQANQAAGFSIVQYNGSLTSTGVVTIGHGLSSAPELIMKKQVNKTGRWYVWHTGSSGANYMLELNSANAQADKSSNGNMSLPTSTVFWTNYTEGSNENTYNNVAYCWHGVEGYSKFGSYEGSGSSDDAGPFIFTGFRPRMVFVKCIDTAAEWAVYDTARDTVNEMGNCLEWDLNATEKTHASNLTTDAMMFFSNGFKPTGGGGGRTNQTGQTYVYGAWGDVPHKYNNAF